jgi:hypothetical protein
MGLKPGSLFRFEVAGFERVVRACLDGRALELPDDAQRADQKAVAFAVPVDAATEAAEVQVGARVLEEFVERVCGMLVASDSVGSAVADPAKAASDAVADEREVDAAVVVQAAAGAHRDNSGGGPEATSGA